MTLTATYPGMSEDPARDSREVRKELTPILRQLQDGLQELEDYINKIDDDETEDQGRHGD